MRKVSEKATGKQFAIDISLGAGFSSESPFYSDISGFRELNDGRLCFRQFDKSRLDRIRAEIEESAPGFP